MIANNRMIELDKAIIHYADDTLNARIVKNKDLNTRHQKRKEMKLTTLMPLKKVR